MQMVFTSWSGGKDSCFACYQAMQNGLDVRYLVNMMDENAEWSWVHRLSARLMEKQSQAIGIPLVGRRSTMPTYENDFKNVILELKKDGVEGGVFGDIDLDEHREWVERICREGDITPHLPLWGLSQEEIMKDFLNLGFEALIVVTNSEYLGEEWLSKKVDRDFLDHLSELKKTTDITPCGEAGEYHTIVTDGPIFKQRLEILETVHRYRNGYWFLEINGSELKPR
ncbi:diphthine--ammonia ligase [Chloroflexota bacterium]